jgi:hypothetical protein
MDMNERLLYLEQRLIDLEKRIAHHEETEYYRYLTAGKSQKVLDSIYSLEKNKEVVLPKKESMFKSRSMWSMKVSK